MASFQCQNSFAEIDGVNENAANPLQLQEEVSEAEVEEFLLMAIQGPLFEKLNEAKETHDFARQLNCLKLMYVATRDLADRRKVFGLEEIEYCARDLQKAVEFADKWKELAIEEETKHALAQSLTEQGEYDQAIALLRRCIAVSEVLYGDGSFRAVTSRIDLAHAILGKGCDLEEGIKAVSYASDVMAKAGMTEFRTYSETQVELTRLYAQSEQYENAIQAGERSVALVVKMQLGEAPIFFETTRLVAHAANQSKRHELALIYAMKGIAAPAPEETGDYYRLFIEAADAKRAMNAPNDAIRFYELLISKVEDDRDCLRSQRIEFFTEYAGFLKSLGDQDRLRIVERKIAKLAPSSDEERKPVREASRYSN
ncbi:tetratricopeptide repeat protein [Blastopirellula sp. JC732]|uniref:Tetratricopeptide repeat protein n=1 Tax=Blastopirellula sediminis TaxID=2894196 RepID=A0A9X1SHS5_9BACT|nr:tetratricopeptide repeat protein [Blastopirellula sediminis]MCC9627464.1 tetratricopeptide repeat protein [Blastopirellula sediminis]